MKEIDLKNFRKVTGKLADEKPWYFAGAVLAAILIVYALLSAMELLPEREPAEKRAATGAQVFDRGDSLDWIGMKVIPVTRTIRNEFKISGKTKGMFVVNEGLGLAAKYGVKTGDVIQSIGRDKVPDMNTFVKAANNAKYSGGIVFDIIRDGKTMYLTVPFEYQYGPIMGPNKGSWQLGSPLAGKAFKYGPVFK